MKALRVICSAAYGPDTLKIIGQAFDEAWKSIAGNFGDDARTVGQARVRLANAIFDAASEGSRDLEALKRAALEKLAQSYRVTA